MSLEDDGLVETIDKFYLGVHDTVGEKFEFITGKERKYLESTLYLGSFAVNLPYSLLTVGTVVGVITGCMAVLSGVNCLESAFRKETRVDRTGFLGKMVTASSFSTSGVFTGFCTYLAARGYLYNDDNLLQASSIVGAFFGSLTAII